MSVVEFFATGFIYVLLSFGSGVVLGYITRKMIQVTLIISGLVLFTFIVDTIGLINTGIQWPNLFNNFLSAIGADTFIVKLATAFLYSIEKAASNTGQPPSPPELTLTSLPSLLVLLLLIIPFILGFLKSLHPGPN
jgi:uncharacterized membrane protein (Fun14 family)